MLLPISTLLIAMISIQSGASLAKNLFPLAGVAGTTCLRISLAALILSLIWRPWRHPVAPIIRKNLLIYGISLGVMNLTFYFAIQRIPLGIAVALEFAGPLGLAVLFSRRKVDFLWVALAMIGIYFVLPASGDNVNLDPLGIFFALFAGACWASYIHFGQKISRVLHGWQAATWGMIVAAMTVLPFGLLLDGPRLATWDVLPWGLSVALLSSAIPYSLEMISLKAIPARTFGILMSLEPVFAALSGLIFLNEKLTLFQWLAIVSIILASAGSSLTASKEAERGPETAGS